MSARRAHVVIPLRKPTWPRLRAPEPVFMYLTEGRGWSVAKTEAWLVEMCVAAMGKYPRRPIESGH